jgi:hypothetical protein
VEAAETEPEQIPVEAETEAEKKPRRRAKSSKTTQ